MIIIMHVVGLYSDVKFVNKAKVSEREMQNNVVSSDEECNECFCVFFLSFPLSPSLSHFKLLPIDPFAFILAETPSRR